MFLAIAKVLVVIFLLYSFFQKIYKQILKFAYIHFYAIVRRSSLHPKVDLYEISYRYSCFLQDNKSDLVINYYVDDVLERVMNILQIEIPTYNEADNPMILAESSIVDWTIPRSGVLSVEKIFKKKCKGVKKKRVLIKNKRNSTELLNGVKAETDKSKVRKLPKKNSNENSGQMSEIKTEIAVEQIKQETVTYEQRLSLVTM